MQPLPIEQVQQAHKALRVATPAQVFLTVQQAEAAAQAVWAATSLVRTVAPVARVFLTTSRARA
jgi:hypothetical protein